MVERFIAIQVFVSCNGPQKNILMLIGSWKGRKNFIVGIFLSKNLLGSGYRKKTIYILGLKRTISECPRAMSSQSPVSCSYIIVIR